MSFLKTINIQHLTSGTNNIVLDANGNMTCAGTISAATPTGGMRNKIINGDMCIDQRNAGAAVTPTNGAYTLDRYQSLASQSSKYTIQQNAGSVTPPAGFIKYLGVTSSSAYTVLAADSFAFRQAIEGFNAADLAWGTASAATVTLSFWVRSSLTGTFGGGIVNYAGTRSYPYTYTISTANTWEQKTITIAGDTSGTWGTDNSGWGFIQFGLGVGSTSSGTAGAWTAGNYQSATGATSVVGTNGATFYLTGIQVETGSVATAFERRPYGTELALCQRYYTTLYPSRPAWCTTTFVMIPLTWPTSMRVAPTIGAPYTDANYTSSGSPTGSQWNIQQVLVAAYTKTGTATFNSSALSAIDNMGFIIITGATFSGTGNFIATSASMPYITVSAEL
jgi:hypothetical protein